MKHKSYIILALVFAVAFVLWYLYRKVTGAVSSAISTASTVTSGGAVGIVATGLSSAYSLGTSAGNYVANLLDLSNGSSSATAIGSSSTPDNNTPSSAMIPNLSFNSPGGF